MIFFKKKIPSTGVVLMYHRVTRLTCDPWQLCVSPDHFDQQMKWLSENTSVVSLADLQRDLKRGRGSSPLIAVTFDDGYADNLIEALPVLETYGIPATFFLTTPDDPTPREFWWDELERIFLQPSDLPPTLRIAGDPDTPTWKLEAAQRYTSDDVKANKQWRAWETPPTLRHEIYAALWRQLYDMEPEQRRRMLNEIGEWANLNHAPRATHLRLSADDIALLSQNDRIEIGAHSVSHTPLPTLSLAQQRQEIEISRRELSALTNSEIASFAYPHGDQSQETTRLVRNAGFRRACTTHPELVNSAQDRYLLPRYTVNDWNGMEFGNKLVSWTSARQPNE